MNSGNLVEKITTHSRRQQDLIHRMNAVAKRNLGLGMYSAERHVKDKETLQREF
jgi:hypothetical protein